MVLISDTRQQEGKHRNIDAYCKRMGIEVVRQKLDVGDYMIMDGLPISVDTKQDIMELCKDVMSSDHRRFRAECVRAKEAGIQLIVLVEEMPPYGKLDLWEIPRWKSSNRWHRYGDPMTMVDPRALRKALITMTVKYGVKFRFCTRRQSPSRVIKYLKGEFQ